MSGEVKALECRIRSEGEAEQAVESGVADAKPGDLRMSRVKSR